MFSYFSRIFFSSICSILLMNLQSFTLRLCLFSSYVLRLHSPRSKKDEKVHQRKTSLNEKQMCEGEARWGEGARRKIHSWRFHCSKRPWIHKSASLLSWFLSHLCNRGLSGGFEHEKQGSESDIHILSHSCLYESYEWDFECNNRCTWWQLPQTSHSFDIFIFQFHAQLRFLLKFNHVRLPLKFFWCRFSGDIFIH